MYTRVVLHPLEQSIRLLVDAGDGLHLWFDDRRVGARLDDRDVAVRLTGADVPSDLAAVLVRGTLGRQSIDARLDPTPHQYFRTTWDGLGAEDGRALVSDLEIGWELAAEFPRPARTRWWSRRIVCGSLDFRSFGLGGFSPDVVHRLDVAAGLVWKAEGDRLENALTERAAVLAGVRVGADEHAVADGERVHVFDRHGLLLGTLQGRKHRVVATAEHDERGRLLRFSKAGHEFAVEHRHDDEGGEVLIESPAEVWIGVELDGDGRAVTLLDHGRNRMSLQYDETGALTRIEDPAGLITEISRDELGRVTALADSTGRADTIERVDQHEVLVTTGEGRTRRLRCALEPDGSLIETEVDAAGLTTIARTDGEGRSVARPDGMVETVSRSVRSTRRTPITVTQHLSEAPSGRVLARTRESAADAERVTIGDRVWIKRFDSGSNTITSVGPDGIESTARLVDGSSLVVSEPGVGDLEVRFDPKRRPKRRRRAGQEVNHGYDQYDRLAWSEIDRVRHRIRHDERGRIVGVQSTRGWTRFDRDPAGWVSAIVDPAGHETRIGRRPDGLISTIVKPGVHGPGPIERRRHDRDGLLVARSWHDGDAPVIEMDYERDSAGRVVAITSGDGKVLVGWDPETGVLAEMYTSDGDSISWTWDGDMCVVETIEGRAAARVERLYDEDQRVIRRAVNRDASLACEYGRDGWLSSVGPLAIERNLSARQVTGHRLGALTTSITRDGEGRMVSQQTRLGRMVTVFFSEEIDRDDAGRIVQVREHANGVNRVIDYRYDDAGRLSETRVDGEVLLALRWDESGNLSSIVRQGRRMSCTSDPANRLATVAGAATAHDARGAVVAIGEDGAARRCDYDGLGQLRRVVDAAGREAEYWYDPLGRPIEVTTSRDGEHRRSTKLVWDGAHLAATLDAEGGLDLHFVGSRTDTTPEAVVRGDHAYLLVRDHLGSVRAVIESSSGTVVQSLAFDPLGRVLHDSNPGWQPFGFCGGITDGVSGLVRFGRRVFDPLIGRFLDPDPDGPAGGSLNAYQFAHGDPVNPVSPRSMTHDDARGAPLSKAAGELSIAADPFLFGRPLPPDRSWTATAAWRTAIGEPGDTTDRVQQLRATWTVERPPETPTFEPVWDPIDWCTGPGGFEYQPSPASASTGPLARVSAWVRNPPTLQQVGTRIQADLARLIESDPD